MGKDRGLVSLTSVNWKKWWSASVNEICRKSLHRYVRLPVQRQTFVAKIRKVSITGLPESESDEDTLAFVNQSLLPALSVPSKFEVIFFHRLGQIRWDSLCRLIFASKIARDIVLVHSRNLMGQAQFVNIRLRPSLTPAQQKQAVF